MTLRDTLATATRPERHRIRAEAVAALPVGASRTVTRGARRLTITADPVAIRSKGGWLVELTVTIERDGRDVTPPDLNPVRIVNPPVLVPDPLGDVPIVRRMVDQATGEARDVVQRHREDPAAALMEVLQDLLRSI